MNAPDFRRYVPPLMIAGLVVAAFVWATSRPPRSEGAPVTSLEEVRENGVVYIEEEGIFIVERGRGVVVLADDAQHIGDKVLYCPSSGLFESPAHGEKFDRLGRYYGGPAATDMDRVSAFAGERGVFLNGSVTESANRSRDALDAEGNFCVPGTPTGEAGFFAEK